MKILIIDENMILSSKLRNQAKDKGYEPKILSFVRQDSYEKIKGFNPDYILINLESKANSSLELIDKLKKDNFKIIGYCGHTRIDLAQKAKDKGANFIATNSSIISHFEEIIKGV
ncbi:MAG: hypothetical protein GXO22_00095 [Aquificae bacterium]|nr:hypothetical protein [Aquificota bacterium]